MTQIVNHATKMDSRQLKNSFFSQNCQNYPSMFFKAKFFACSFSITCSVLVLFNGNNCLRVPCNVSPTLIAHVLFCTRVIPYVVKAPPA